MNWFKNKNKGSKENLSQQKENFKNKVSIKPGKQINVYTTFPNVKWWGEGKFGVEQQAPWMHCLYSRSELVHLSQVTQRKRKDLSPYVEQRLAMQKKYILRKIVDDEIDTSRLLQELNIILACLDEDSMKEAEKIGPVDHRNCHTLFPRNLINYKLNTSSKNKKLATHLTVDEFSKNIGFIIPSQLNTGKNTQCEVQLDQFLNDEKSRTPEVQIISFIYQIVLAVSWLHEKDIVHADIRCRNIYVFKKDQNWLARLCLAGCGSLIKYVKKGYGYRNEKNPNIHRDTRDADMNKELEDVDVAPIASNATTNDVLTKSFKRFSKPPGADKRQAITNLTMDDNRATFKSRTKNKSRSPVRRDRMASDAGVLTLSQYRSSSLDDLSQSKHDPDCGKNKKTISADNDYSNSSNATHRKHDNKIDTYKLQDLKDESLDPTQIQLRTKAESVFWQPPEIHKQLMDKTFIVKTSFNKKTDIYQLGCTMFEMITYGVKPFVHRSLDILTKRSMNVIQSGLFEYPMHLDCTGGRYILDLASHNQLQLGDCMSLCTRINPNLRPTGGFLENPNKMLVIKPNRNRYFGFIMNITKILLSP